MPTMGKPASRGVTSSRGTLGSAGISEARSVASAGTGFAVVLIFFFTIIPHAQGELTPLRRRMKYYTGVQRASAPEGGRYGVPEGPAFATGGPPPPTSSKAYSDIFL